MNTRRGATAERSRARIRRWSGTRSWQWLWLASWAGCVLACSSPTDVVAVFDPNDTAVEAASSPRPIPDLGGDADTDDSAGVVIVLGRPVPNWQGPTLEWPLDTPLDKFFADPGHDSKSTHSKPAQGGSTAPRGNAIDPHGTTNKTPSVPPESAPMMRILDSDGDIAERLKALFAEAPRTPGIQQSIVVRDEFDDVYLIVLKEGGCVPASDRGAGSGCSAPLGFE
jgi:hypothetical protein